MKAGCDSPVTDAGYFRPLLDTEVLVFPSLLGGEVTLETPAGFTRSPPEVLADHCPEIPAVAFAVPVNESFLMVASRPPEDEEPSEFFACQINERVRHEGKL